MNSEGRIVLGSGVVGSVRFLRAVAMECVGKVARYLIEGGPKPFIK